MTRAEDQQGVRADRAAHGPDGDAGGTDAGGDLAVRRGRPVRHGVEGVPDAGPELGAFGTQLQLELLEFTGEVGSELLLGVPEGGGVVDPTLLDGTAVLLLRNGQRGQRAGLVGGEEQGADGAVETGPADGHDFSNSPAVRRCCQA